MKRPSAGHGCSGDVNENLVFVAGGYLDQQPVKETEYFNLTSLTWSSLPELPVVAGIGTADMVGSATVGEDTIFKLEDLGIASRKRWQWVEVAKRKFVGSSFGAYFIIEKVCK